MISAIKIKCHSSQWNSCRVLIDSSQVREVVSVHTVAGGNLVLALAFQAALGYAGLPVHPGLQGLIQLLFLFPVWVIPTPKHSLVTELQAQPLCSQ